MEENKEPKKPNDNLQSNSDIQKNEKTNQVSEVQLTDEFNVTSNNSVKKGNSKLYLLIPIVLIIIIVLGIMYYFTVYTKPDKIYKRLIESSITSYTKQTEDTNYKTSKTLIKLDANVESDLVSKDVLNLINKTDVKIEMQTDNEDKQVIVKLDADYDKDDLLNIQMYSDVKNEKTYMYLADFLDKYIETELDDEMYSAFRELLDTQNRAKNAKKSQQTATEILKNELTAIIKPEYCSSQKEDIKINDNTVSTTKNTIKMTITQFRNEFLTIFKNLKNNDKFINCFENKDEVLDSLDVLIDEFEEIEEEEDDVIIEINMYNKGIMQERAKFEIKINSRQSEETVTIGFTKLDDTTYYFEVFEDNNEKLLTGTLNIEEKSEEEKTLNIKMDINEFGKIELKIDCTQKFDEDIDRVDVNNSIKTDNLTQEDQMTLLNNLQNSKLFELIQEYVGLTSGL